MDGPILVPTDGSEPATAALEHALEIAAETDVPVHVLTVVDDDDPLLARLGESAVAGLEREAATVVDRAASMAEDRGVTAIESVVEGRPREAILDYAAREDVGLVIVGAHGRRGFGTYVFGSTTEAVVTESEVPVVTIRGTDDERRSYPYERVLVPTDGSAHARAALELASRIATRTGATVHLLFVVDELPETIDPRSTTLSTDVAENARETLDEAVADLDLENVVTAVESGSVAAEITAYADANDVDLVVMGTHGCSGIDRYLVGSFTERVIRTSPAPVLTTTASEESSTHD